MPELKMSLLQKNKLGHDLIVHSTVWGGFLVILNMQITEFAQISMNNGDKQTDESPSWRSPPPCPLFVHSRLCLQLHLNGDYKVQTLIYKLQINNSELQFKNQKLQIKKSWNTNCKFQISLQKFTNDYTVCATAFHGQWNFIMVCKGP